MKLADFELELQSNDFDTASLRIHRLRAVERMSQLFEIELEVVALGDARLDVDAASGARVQVVISVDDEQVRRLNGIVSRIAELPVLGKPEDQTHAVYRLDIRPRAWLSTLVETLDIHLASSVPAILEKKLGMFDLSLGQDVALELMHDYPAREMTVQYKETDLAFVSRLCEHWGIFFYYDQADADRLVFGDDAGAYRPIAGDASVAYRARGDRRGVYELMAERALVPATYVCRDYNDQTPALELMEQHKLEEGFGGGIIEYGGDFRNPDEGKRLARVRAEERLCTHQIYSGTSAEPRFAPGHVFSLEQHPRHSRKLLLVSVTHEATQNVAGWGDGTEKSYQNRFTAIPAELTYRPPRVTRVPRIHGLLTGVIESSQGDLKRHAKLDEQGRYTVRFLFDTAAPGERKASCQVRMMQSLAGPGYGVHFPLKPGTEVTLAFLDGNPDRPIILGAVPNPITPTPVNAPVSTKSRIKTRSGIVIEFEDADRG